MLVCIILNRFLNIGELLVLKSINKFFFNATINCFNDTINEVNQELYNVICISATNEMTVFDFYKTLCDQLYLDTGAYYRAKIYKKINN